MAALLLLLLPALGYAEVAMDAVPWCGIAGPPGAATVWTDARELGVRGRGWPAAALAGPYSRLPATAEALLCGPAPCASACPTAACVAQVSSTQAQPKLRGLPLQCFGRESLILSQRPEPGDLAAGPRSPPTLV
jgi:hypothetical protein